MTSLQQMSFFGSGFGELLHHCWELFRGGEERNYGGAGPPTFILKTEGVTTGRASKNNCFSFCFGRIKWNRRYTCEVHVVSMFEPPKDLKEKDQTTSQCATVKKSLKVSDITSICNIYYLIMEKNVFGDDLRGMKGLFCNWAPVCPLYVLTIS